MGAFDHSDVIDVLRSRAGILLALSEGGKSPADLTSELSVSRSTVDRGLGELERLGFVEVADGIARSTLSGRLAVDTYTQFVANLDDIGALGTAFESTPADAEFDPVLLSGGTAVVADGPDDERPLERLAAITESATAIHGCVRDASQELLEACYRRLLDDDVSVDLVASEDVVERLVTTYRPQLVELFEFDSFSLRSADSLPYTLLVVDRPDGPMAVLATYASGRLVGVVANDSDSAVAWARERIDHCWDESDTLPLSPESGE